jgi:KDO2-lipid IV(A) lauroyltransferase
MTLPAKLAQMSGATIILSYAERLPFGKGYVVHFVPFERQLTGTPEEQAGIVNTAMEELIARCPSQYFWSYNRFKGQPPSIALSTDQAS